MEFGAVWYGIDTDAHNNVVALTTDILEWLVSDERVTDLSLFGCSLLSKKDS
jgi:hypothetical protein